MKVGIAVSGVLATIVLLISPSLFQDVKDILVLPMESPRQQPTQVAAKAIRVALEPDPRNQIFEEYMDESRLGFHYRALESGLGGYGRTRIDLVLTFGQLAILIVQAVLVILLILHMVRRRRSDEAIQRLTGRVINAAEDERKHIARELHDDIGQRLSLISIQLDSILPRTPSLRTNGEMEIVDLHRELDALISDVHDLSHRLHSSKLEHLGLNLALKDLCRRVSRQHSVHVDFSAPTPTQKLPGEVALCFYRVAQEGLSNVVRHSGSPSVEVKLEEGAGRVRMEIRDFGVGFDPAPRAEGLGLATMQERLRTVGGKFSVVSRRGEGTLLTAEANVSASSRAA